MQDFGREQCIDIERFLDGNQDKFLSVVLEIGPKAKKEMFSRMIKVLTCSGVMESHLTGLWTLVTNS